MPGPWSEALRTVLLALGGLLVLATLLGADAAECPTQGAPERGFFVDAGTKAVRQGAKVSKRGPRKGGAQFHVTDLGGWGSALHVASGPGFSPPSSSRGGRDFLPPDLQALQRWGRERRHAVARVTLRERRSAAAPDSSGEIADRPSIATRPLRGPPPGA